MYVTDRRAVLPGVHGRVLAVHRALGAAFDMEGPSVSLAAEESLGPLTEEPGTGSWQVRRRFAATTAAAISRRNSSGVLEQHGLTHQRIKPHCPEENGLVERSNRTLREALEETELSDRQQAEERLGGSSLVQRRATAQRLGLPAAGGLLPRRPDELHEARRKKLAQARHRRRRTKPSATTTNLAHGRPPHPLTNRAIRATAGETFQVCCFIHLCKPLKPLKEVQRSTLSAFIGVGEQF